MADVWTYKPAKTVMRLKHLLNFSSGLFYAMKGFQPDQQSGAYIALHDKKDPIGHFLSVLKVSSVSSQTKGRVFIKCEFGLLQGDLPGIPILFEPGTNCELS